MPGKTFLCGIRLGANETPASGDVRIAPPVPTATNRLPVEAIARAPGHASNEPWLQTMPSGDVLMVPWLSNSTNCFPVQVTELNSSVRRASRFVQTIPSGEVRRAPRPPTVMRRVPVQVTFYGAIAKGSAILIPAPLHSNTYRPRLRFPMGILISRSAPVRISTILPPVRV